MMNSDAADATNSAVEEESKKAVRELRPFPRKVLSEAVKIINAIRDQNAGKPWSPGQIADALGKKQRSSDFQYIIAAANDFGLTEGRFRAPEIKITDLGKRVCYPANAADERKALFESFSNIPLFRQVYDHYSGSNIPEKKYFRNTLIDKFKINHDHVDEFITLFEGNLRFLNIEIKEKIVFDIVELTDKRATETRSLEASLVRSGRSIAFVIMPFVEKNPARPLGFFKEVFHSLISPAGHAAGFEIEWANQFGTDLIQSTIINKIFDADLIIADLTDHNPNVMFELGLRVGDNKKPTALIKSKDTGRLFDVDNMMRVYEYDPSLWKTTLEIDIPNLEQHIRATWENRSINASYVDILRKRGDT